MGACGAGLYAFDRSTGVVLWHHAPGCQDGGVSGTAMVFERQVFLAPGEAGSGDRRARRAQLTGRVLPSPPLRDLCGLRSGSCLLQPRPWAAGLRPVERGRRVLGRSRGTRAWSWTPFVAGGTAYVASSTGQIFGVDESTGVQTWSAQASSGPANPVVGAEGVLVAVQYASLGVVAYGHVDLPDASVVLGDGAAPTPIVLASGGGPESLALDATKRVLDGRRERRGSKSCRRTAARRARCLLGREYWSRGASPSTRPVSTGRCRTLPSEVRRPS